MDNNYKEEKELMKKIKQGIEEGVARALEEHKRAGRSISISKNGKVVEVPPDQIPDRKK